MEGDCWVWGKEQNTITLAVFLHQPVRIGLPTGEKTVISCLVNSTVQSALQTGPTPMRVFVNDGMTYPVVGKSCAICGIGRDAVPEEDSTWTVAVPTHICIVAAFRSPCGSEGAMYTCCTRVYYTSVLTWKLLG